MTTIQIGNTGEPGDGREQGDWVGTVRRLIGAGHRVYLAARDVERGRTAAEALGARFVELDVTSDASVRLAANVVEREEGHLDVLVNNAGITGPCATFMSTPVKTGSGAADERGWLRQSNARIPSAPRTLRDPRIVNVSSGLALSPCSTTQVESSRVPVRHFMSRQVRNQHVDRSLRATTSRYPHQQRRPRYDCHDLSGGQGHSVKDGTDAIIAFAIGGPTLRPVPTVTATAIFPVISNFLNK